MVNEFPTTINIADKIKVVENVIISALERSIFDASVAYSEVMLAADVSFIIKVLTESLKRRLNFANDNVFLLDEGNRSFVIRTMWD